MYVWADAKTSFRVIDRKIKRCRNLSVLVFYYFYWIDNFYFAFTCFAARVLFGWNILRKFRTGAYRPWDLHWGSELANEDAGQRRDQFCNAYYYYYYYCNVAVAAMLK
jgi:hypothetical protein